MHSSAIFWLFRWFLSSLFACVCVTQKWVCTRTARQPRASPSSRHTCGQGESAVSCAEWEQIHLLVRSQCSMQCEDSHLTVQRTVTPPRRDDWFPGNWTARNLIMGRDLRQKTPRWLMFLPVRGLFCSHPVAPLSRGCSVNGGNGTKARKVTRLCIQLSKTSQVTILEKTDQV